MPTIKLVVIGTSGVGKTSLRGQYISGRFSDGYRATIGADFISKTLPHPTDLDGSVVLQIWDTAGQERFSSLSNAFFRGADAVLLIFDVNEPSTMTGLKKWWADFKEKAPLEDEDVDDYCCVVVGNKIDVKNDHNSRVSESEALSFLDELVPPLPPSIGVTPHPNTTAFRTSSIPLPSSSKAIPLSQTPASYSPKHSLTKSRTRSPSRFYGTATSTRTNLTIYHTPSSSLFESYYSARSSPEPGPASPAGSSFEGRARRPTTISIGSGSSGVTITPSIFARDREILSSTLGTRNNLPDPAPERGPKLFFTSAKTGEGVSEVFEYISQRVIKRWAYEERMEAELLHYRDTSGDDTIPLELGRKKGGRTTRDANGIRSPTCCA